MRTFAQKPKAVQQDTFAKFTTPGRAHFEQSREVSPVLHLQRTIGNQAVQRLLQTSAGDLGEASSSLASPRFEHDFSRIPVNHNQVLARTALEEPASLRSFDREGPEASKLDQQPERRRTSPGSVSMVVHHRDRFSASIRRADRPRPSGIGGPLATGERSALEPRFAARYNDAMPGNEQTSIIDLASLLSQTKAAPVESISEPQEGRPVRLPDIVFDQGTVETDAIASTLTYAPTVTQSGPAPAPFGETLPYTFIMSGINVTLAPGTFNVTATIDNPITFQVASGGKIDISSETDPDITQANYPTVASDLTPNMSDLNGRPPRTQFWAQDLCIRHERFHATDGIGHAGSGVTLAQNWLNTQTASSVADVNTLLGQAPARVIAARSAAMAYPGRENRAYGDGAPAYLARATAIKTKGDANGYAPPAPPPSPAPVPAPKP